MKTKRQKMSNRGRKVLRYILVVPVFLFIIPFIYNPFDIDAIYLAIAYAVLVFPSAILSIRDIARTPSKKKTAPKVKQSPSVEEHIDPPAPAPARLEHDDSVRFRDEHGKVKFSTEADSIVYISAEDNYVKIYYLKDGVVNSFQLRNTMNAIEPTAAAARLIRCHRSYYINPQYITVLCKDSDGGILAEFIKPGIDPVPVSKKYYEQVSHVIPKKK